MEIFFGYIGEIKGLTKKQGVRFVVDLNFFRPADTPKPLNIATRQEVMNMLAKTTPIFDNTCFRVLVQASVYSHLSTTEQQALVRRVGYQSVASIGIESLQGFSLWSSFL